MQDWLTWSDGWDTWLRYQTGFSVLTLSLFYYVYVIAETLRPNIASVSVLYSLWLPLLAIVTVESIRWYVLVKFSQDDKPFEAWVRSLWK